MRMNATLTPRGKLWTIAGRPRLNLQPRQRRRRGLSRDAIGDAYQRQRDQQEFHPARGSHFAGFARLKRQSREFADGVGGGATFAVDHEQNLARSMRRNPPACTGLEFEHRDRAAAFGECTQKFFGDALLPGRHPFETGRLHADWLVVAWLGIGQPALVDVLPDRLVAVLVAPLARLKLAVAAEHSFLELAERLHLLDRGGDLFRAEITGAAGAAELQGNAQSMRLAVLWAIGRALREINNLARIDPLVLAVILRITLEAHPQLIEIVPMPRHVEFAALPYERQLVVAGRALVAAQQRLELSIAATDGVAALRAFFGVGDMHLYVSSCGSIDTERAPIISQGHL